MGGLKKDKPQHKINNKKIPNHKTKQTVKVLILLAHQRLAISG